MIINYKGSIDNRHEVREFILSSGIVIELTPDEYEEIIEYPIQDCVEDLQEARNKVDDLLIKITEDLTEFEIENLEHNLEELEELLANIQVKLDPENY